MLRLRMLTATEMSGRVHVATKRRDLRIFLRNSSALAGGLLPSEQSAVQVGTATARPVPRASPMDRMYLSW